MLLSTDFRESHVLSNLHSGYESTVLWLALFYENNVHTYWADVTTSRVQKREGLGRWDCPDMHWTSIFKMGVQFKKNGLQDIYWGMQMEVILGMHAIQGVLSGYHQISALSWSQHMNKKKVLFFSLKHWTDSWKITWKLHKCGFIEKWWERHRQIKWRYLVKIDVNASEMWFYIRIARTSWTNKIKIFCENWC